MSDTTRFFLLALLSGLIAFTAIYFYRDARLNNQNAFVPDEESGRAVVLLYENTDLDGLIEILSVLGVSYNETELRWASDILGYRRFLRGRYELNDPSSYDQFLAPITRGEEDPLNVIVHPGMTYDRFYQRIANQFSFEADELRELMQDEDFIREELGLDPHLLFGRMIPNTYQMFWTISPQQFLNRMLTEFDRVVTRMEEQIEESGLNVDEVITFASIVELEARYDHEKPKISGLYWNRLNSRWRMQADPTVSYALGERRRLTFADYRFSHPYNTYQIHGLPPGPITNPSISSIRAVLNPESHDYMFMVATPEGTHAFTRTLAEHRVESEKWRTWLREQRRLREERERLDSN